MTDGPEIIPVPKPSGKISFGNLAEDLRMAYAHTGGGEDPWRVVARRAIQLVPRTLPEPPPDPLEES